jgi:hypothetical protein
MWLIMVFEQRGYVETIVLSSLIISLALELNQNFSQHLKLNKNLPPEIT